MDSESRETNISECSSLSLQNLSTPVSSCGDISCQEKSSISEEPNSKKIFKCSHNNCDSVFYRYSHLQDHLNRHTGICPYRCKEKNCSKAYSTWANLRKHLISSHQLELVRKSLYMCNRKVIKEYKCHKCPYECIAAFDRKWKLRSHICTHIGEKLYICSVDGCSKAYTTIGHLRRHNANCHSSRPKVICEYSCSEEGCKNVYKSMGSIKRHYIRHHRKDQHESDYKCASCGQHFSTPHYLANHKCISSKRKSYKCDECNVHFTCITTWKKHSKIHSTFECNVPGCSQQFSRFALLRKHKKLEHRESFPCKSCNKKFSSKHTLRVHQQTHLLPYERKVFQCPYSECCRIYTRKSNLDQHIRSGHRDIKFQCSFQGCGKRLVTKQKLQEHEKIHDPARVPAPRKQIARRQRKDAGKPKRSMAIKLSGLEVSYAEEKKVLCPTTNKIINSRYMLKYDDISNISLEASDDEDWSSENSSDTSEAEELNEP